MTIQLPKVGRPKLLDEKMEHAILSLLEEGNSLRAICDMDGMPNKATVYRHFTTHKEFGDKYARAREVQADQIFDELEDIGRAMLDCDNSVKVQAFREFKDAQKWRLSKLFPKKYGERQIVQGDVDADPIQHSLAARLDNANKALRSPMDTKTIDITPKVIETPLPARPSADSDE